MEIDSSRNDAPKLSGAIILSDDSGRRTIIENPEPHIVNLEESAPPRIEVLEKDFKPK